MTEWKQSQAKRFAKDVVIGRTYYTVNQQSAHASTYGPARTVSQHVFTGHSLVTGQAMTDGRTSAFALCNNKGPVYDEHPGGHDSDSRSKSNRKGVDRASREFDKRARGLFGGKR